MTVEDEVRRIDPVVKTLALSVSLANGKALNELFTTIRLRWAHASDQVSTCFKRYIHREVRCRQLSCLVPSARY